MPALRWVGMSRAIFITGLVALGMGLANGQQGKSLGSPQAPIHIDLYSDYQCPACKLLHDQTLAPLISDYVKTGKVYLVHHEFPLPMHSHAREAACLACAAEKLGKYERVGDQLFLTQETWAGSGDVVGAACSVLDASDAKKLRELAATPEIKSEVDNDIRAGQAEKVNATPTMIITKLVQRYPVVGPVSYPVLRKFLDSLLD